MDSAGVRQSRQRDVVLEIVRSTMDHPTADWVYRQARRRLPRISLATVYRNLKQLAARGLIREIQAGGPASRFDGNIGRHYHIRCLGCGRLSDLPLSVSKRLEDEARRATSYRILGHEVEVHGLCPLCQGDGVTVENCSH
ncbi:MAG TPA: transcriptional repressor [Vicinamibacteria bacterium]|nr:transcriptional repressor [Vicinamibacteria bacterium]